VAVGSAVRGGLLRTMKGHTWVVWSVAFSPDEAKSASGAEASTVRLWAVVGD
jgi:WD40 repeat protein